MEVFHKKHRPHIKVGKGAENEEEEEVCLLLISFPSFLLYIIVGHMTDIIYIGRL